jgi:hypothetical protein
MRLAQVCLALLILVGGAEAGIVNGGFEQPVLGATPGYAIHAAGSGFLGWTLFGATYSNSTVLNGYVESRQPVGPPPGNPTDGQLTFNGHGGNQHLDVTGVRNTGLGAIWQDVETRAGQGYALTFWVGNMDAGDYRYRQPASVSVQIGGSSLDQQQFTEYANINGGADRFVNWTQMTHLFIANSTTTRIWLVNTTASGAQVWDNYAGLDDVELIENPEPATLALIGTALTALVLLRRRS